MLVTRPVDRSDELCALIDAAGYEPVCIPTIEIAPVSDTRQLDDALRRFAAYDVVVFSSATSARLLCLRARALRLSLARPGAIVAGPATAAALAGHGLPATHALPRFSADAALDALDALPLAGRRVLLPRATEGRETLAEGLRARGAVVQELIVYSTVPITRSARLVEALRDPLLCAVLLFSPSAVTGLANALEAADESVSLAGRLAVACIGQTTASAARAAGLRVHVVPPETTAAALVHALRAHLSSAAAAGATGTTPLLVPAR
ncbi:MAG TPA: uroporphyrinogen-III synthase [Chloroflexota bacterium]|nr:uroporphyrinogen-III synthase [Chloroflexota bacterium]